MLKDYLNIEFVKKINDIAVKAGQLILDIYENGFNVNVKQDSSPITEADLASHHYIVDCLNSLTPDVPILSEESSEILWQKRSKWQTYWLIDPLDGTKEFVKRNGEFTVNIALIHKGFPVLGVVYAPVLEALYYATSDIGAWKKENIGDAMEISTSTNESSQDSIRIVISRSHSSALLDNYIKQFRNYELLKVGSSLKLCIIAEGKADLYPRLGPTSEWDTAASQAIVEAAGGVCINYETNERLTYNTKDSLLNPFFIVKGCTS